jgi:hypothetical protein
MKKFLKTLRACVLDKLFLSALAALALLVALDRVNYACSIRVGPVQVEAMGSAGLKTFSATLPYSASSARGFAVYTYKGSFDYKRIYPSKVRIVPDDAIIAIEVNNVDVDLSAFTSRSLRDWRHGVLLDLGPYIHEGSNLLEVTVRDAVPATIAPLVGKTGLRLEPMPFYQNPIALPIGVLALFCAVFFLASLLRAKGVDGAIVALFAVTLAVHVFYLCYTPFDKATYDVLDSGGHLDYIEYIGDHLAFPQPDKGWEYHQPPLYYMSAAGLSGLMMAVGVNDLYSGYQILSLFYFVAFTAVAYKILSMFLTDRKWLFVATALVLCWPSGFIHAVRIGNDVLFYLLFALGALYAERYRRDDRAGDLYLSALFGALAILTKANGVILIAVLATILVFRFFKRRGAARAQTFRRGVLVAAIGLVGLALNIGDNVYYSVVDKGKDWLLGDVGETIDRRLFVGNKAENYLFFDPSNFVSHPYTDTRLDSMGRQYFWNFLLRTSLYGEFKFWHEPCPAIAVASGVVLLAFLVLFIAGILYRKRAEFPPLAVSLLSMGFSLLVLLMYRSKVPVSCNGDFRYIYPVLIPFALVLVDSLRVFEQRGKSGSVAATGGLALILAFSLANLLFFVV